MKISVIVPVYNVAADLPRCMDSILAQTYPNIEIVTVDDGSPDNSGAILDEYAANYSNIRVIHKENGGVTSARLRGIEEATGEWIGFVDGDDEIEPDMYARLLKNAVEYDADISHCGYQMCFADGRVHYFHNTGISEKHDKITGIRELLSGERVEPGLCNKLFRKTLFQGWEMDETIRINEDLLMNYYLFSNARSSVFDDWCPYHYIVRSTSASRVRLNEYKIYDPIKVKKIILEKCEKDNLIDAQRAYITTCTYTYCGLVMNGKTAKHRRSVRNEIWQKKKWISLLPVRTKLLAELVVYAPVFLKIAYPIYSNYLQSKKYD